MDSDTDSAYFQTEDSRLPRPSDDSTTRPSTINCSAIPQEFSRMLSLESQNILQLFQRLPLKEKKVLFMLAGDIIAETDNDLDLSALPDEQIDDKFCVKQEDEQQYTEKLDLELFQRLGQFVQDVRDSSFASNQLLTLYGNQEETIKKMASAQAKSKEVVHAMPNSVFNSTPSINTFLAGNSGPGGNNWMNFSRNSNSVTSTSRKMDTAVAFTSSSYFTGTNSPAITSIATERNSSSSNFQPQVQVPSAAPTEPQQEQARSNPVLAHSPYSLPSLEFFMAKQGNRPVPKRKGKGDTLKELSSKPITSYLTTEFRAPSKPKLTKPNPREVEEFNDMFADEAKPEETGPTDTENKD